MTHPYIPLANGSDHPTRFSRPPLILLGVSLVVNLILFYTLFSAGGSPSGPVYSPAETSISYVAKSFDRGFQNAMPIYEQEPSEEVDRAWRELTRYTVSKITKSEAEQMANHTYPLIHEEGYYMSGLDVFHQLHCLDMLRQSLYPEYYPSMSSTAHNPLRRAHMAHCVGHVRQALMCAADVTPIVWQWEEDAQLVRRKDDVPHTCRNWDEVYQWANERDYYVDDDDMRVYVHDGL